MAQSATSDEVKQEDSLVHSSDSGIQKDLTTCSICFETFKRPKYLPCLHSFCESCLQSYIDSTKLKVKEDSGGIPGIVCPLCRLFVKLPDGCEWNQWAYSVPVNHLLASVIDADVAKRSKICDACARENESKNATVWCTECAERLCELCERQHRRFKYGKNHNVVDIGNMEQLQQSVISQSHEIMCPAHPQKALEAYCEDHSAVCCLTCAMLNHRKCEQVGTIENAVQEKKKKGEDTALKESFVGMKKSLASAKEAVDENLVVLRGQISDIESSIHQAYDDFIKHGQKLRDEKLEELRSLEKSLIPATECKRDEILGKICAIDNDLQLLSTTVDLAPDAQFLLNFNRLLEQKFAIQVFLEKKVLEQTKLSEMKFEKYSGLFSLSGVMDSFGEMVVETRNLACGCSGVIIDPGPDNADVLNLIQVKPTLKHSVPVGSREVIGMEVVGDNIVIISENSQAVELLNTKGACLSSIMLDSNAVGLRMLNKSEGMVVEKRKITFFKVKESFLHDFSNIKALSLRRITESNLPENTLAFAHHGSSLYIADELFKEITIKDMGMKTHSRMFVQHSIHRLGVKSDGNVIYTSTRNDAIYCIRPDGSRVWRFSDEILKKTEGLAIDKSGNVLVCEGKMSHHGYVYLLTKSGKFHSKFLSYRSSSPPKCISINEYERKIAVGGKSVALVYDISLKDF
ncbi:hypothetical protein FSP39_009032 [Pinctada imbricata]|uniref:Uncharacterized protein n=1 Tax=Pinctada imbricata TaxID=66713 RepID=A0AA88XN04_PINIB|nr:hypothetical protein FSP39_009032 [Pinctada imbricata]